MPDSLPLQPSHHPASAGSSSPLNKFTSTLNTLASTSNPVTKNDVEDTITELQKLNLPTGSLDQIVQNLHTTLLKIDNPADRHALLQQIATLGAQTPSSPSLQVGGPSRTRSLGIFAPPPPSTLFIQLMAHDLKNGAQLAPSWDKPIPGLFDAVSKPSPDGTTISLDQQVQKFFEEAGLTKDGPTDTVSPRKAAFQLFTSDDKLQVANNITPTASLEHFAEIFGIPDQIETYALPGDETESDHPLPTSGDLETSVDSIHESLYGKKFDISKFDSAVFLNESREEPKSLGDALSQARADQFNVLITLIKKATISEIPEKLDGVLAHFGKLTPKEKQVLSEVLASKDVALSPKTTDKTKDGTRTTKIDGVAHTATIDPVDPDGDCGPASLAKLLNETTGTSLTVQNVRDQIAAEIYQNWDTLYKADMIKHIANELAAMFTEDIDNWRGQVLGQFIWNTLVDNSLITHSMVHGTQHYFIGENQLEYSFDKKAEIIQTLTKTLTKEDFAKLISTKGYWIGKSELTAAAKIWNVNIRLFGKGKGKSKGDITVSETIPGPKPDTNPTINIHWNGTDHFDPIVSLTETTQTASSSSSGKSPSPGTQTTSSPSKKASTKRETRLVHHSKTTPTTRRSSSIPSEYLIYFQTLAALNAERLTLSPFGTLFASFPSDTGPHSIVGLRVPTRMLKHRDQIENEVGTPIQDSPPIPHTLKHELILLHAMKTAANTPNDIAFIKAILPLFSLELQQVVSRLHIFSPDHQDMLGVDPVINLGSPSDLTQPPKINTLWLKLSPAFRKQIINLYSMLQMETHSHVPSRKELIETGFESSDPFLRHHTETLPPFNGGYSFQLIALLTGLRQREMLPASHVAYDHHDGRLQVAVPSSALDPSDRVVGYIGRSDGHKDPIVEHRMQHDLAQQLLNKLLFGLPSQIQVPIMVPANMLHTLKLTGSGSTDTISSSDEKSGSHDLASEHDGTSPITPLAIRTTVLRRNGLLRGKHYLERALALSARTDWSSMSEEDYIAIWFTVELAKSADLSAIGFDANAMQNLTELNNPDKINEMQSQFNENLEDASTALTDCRTGWNAAHSSSGSSESEDAAEIGDDDVDPILDDSAGTHTDPTEIDARALDILNDLAGDDSSDSTGSAGLASSSSSLVDVGSADHLVEIDLNEEEAGGDSDSAGSAGLASSSNPLVDAGSDQLVEIDLSKKTPKETIATLYESERSDDSKEPIPLETIAKNHTIDLQSITNGAGQIEVEKLAQKLIFSSLHRLRTELLYTAKTRTFFSRSSKKGPEIRKELNRIVTLLETCFADKTSSSISYQMTQLGIMNLFDRILFDMNQSKKDTIAEKLGRLRGTGTRIFQKDYFESESTPIRSALIAILNSLQKTPVNPTFAVRDSDATDEVSDQLLERLKIAPVSATLRTYRSIIDFYTQEHGHHSGGKPIKLSIEDKHLARIEQELESLAQE